MNTAACKSAISYIDGDKGILRYRGYPIEQLAERSNYTEVTTCVHKLPRSPEVPGMVRPTACGTVGDAVGRSMVWQGASTGVVHMQEQVLDSQSRMKIAVCRKACSRDEVLLPHAVMQAPCRDLLQLEHKLIFIRLECFKVTRAGVLPDQVMATCP